MEQDLVLTDVYTVAAIAEITGRDPELQLGENGLVVFRFPGTPANYSALADFSTDATGSISRYAQTVKRLRGEMLSMRGWGRR